MAENETTIARVSAIHAWFTPSRKFPARIAPARGESVDAPNVHGVCVSLVRSLHFQRSRAGTEAARPALEDVDRPARSGIPTMIRSDRHISYSVYNYAKYCVIDMRKS